MIESVHPIFGELADNPEVTALFAALDAEQADDDDESAILEAEFDSIGKRVLGIEDDAVYVLAMAVSGREITEMALALAHYNDHNCAEAAEDLDGFVTQVIRGLVELATEDD